MPVNKKDHIAYYHYLNSPLISIDYGFLGNQCQHRMEMDQFLSQLHSLYRKIKALTLVLFKMEGIATSRNIHFWLYLNSGTNF